MIEVKSSREDGYLFDDAKVLHDAIVAICELDSKNDGIDVPIFDPDIKQITVEYLGETTLERGISIPHGKSKLCTSGERMNKIDVTTDGWTSTIYTAEVLELFFYALKNQELTNREYLSRILYYIDNSVKDTNNRDVFGVNAVEKILKGLRCNLARDIGTKVLGNLIPRTYPCECRDLDILEGMIKISKSDADTVHVEAIHDKASLNFMTELKAQLTSTADDIESFYKEDGAFNVENFRNNVLVLKSMGKRLSTAIEDAIEADESIKKIFATITADSLLFCPEMRACNIYTDMRLHLMGIDENMNTNRLVRYVEQEISNMNERIDCFMREYDKSMYFRYSANAITPRDKVDDK